MHEIEVEPSHRTANGERYTVRYINKAIHGKHVLLHSARDPLTEGARELKNKGCTGKIGMRWKGSEHIAMIGDIDKLAELAIADGAKAGPRWCRWVPFAELEGQAAE